MIPGAGAIGQFPNLSIGLPIARSGKSVTIKIRPTKKASVRLQPRKLIRLAKFPNSST